jgi:hypothetical protein
VHEQGASQERDQGGKNKGRVVTTHRVMAVIGFVLMAGCAGIEREPPPKTPPATAAEAPVPAEARAVAVVPPAASSPPVVVQRAAAASAPVVQAAPPARVAPQSGNTTQPRVSTPPAPAVARPAASSPPATPPVKMPAQTPTPILTPTPAPVLRPAAAPPLDLKSLETRLKETKAIGVFTKLALKNQIDELLDRFRAFYQGRVGVSLVELRRSYDMLVMKTLALLQDADAPLAGALASSRESIWGILSDRAKFATL